jgi:hypothetical protein
MKGVAKSAFVRVPVNEHLFGALELAGRDFEAQTAVQFGDEPEFFEPEFVMDFGGYSCLSQATLNRLRLGTIIKKRNGYPVHITTSSSAAENQGEVKPENGNAELWNQEVRRGEIISGDPDPSLTDPR